MTITVLEHQLNTCPKEILDWAASHDHEVQLIQYHQEESAPLLWDIDLLVVLEDGKKALLGNWGQETEMALIEACILAGRPLLVVSSQPAQSTAFYASTFVKTSLTDTNSNTVAFTDTKENLAKILDRLATLPRHNYRRIDCGYYDHIELSIMRRTRRAVGVKFVEKTITIPDMRLLDTMTKRGEEYVELEGLGWVRADRITLIGVDAAGTCAF